MEQTMPSPCPLGARRVWNKNRPMKKPKSTIAKFSDGGEKSYPIKPSLAPGVPKNQGTVKGYFPPGSKPKSTRAGGGGTYDTEQSAGAGIGVGHTGYS